MSQIEITKQPVFKLNMAYGDLTPKNANQGSYNVIVSLDHKPANDPTAVYRPQDSNSFSGTAMISQSQNVEGKIGALNGFQPNGNNGTKPRDGRPYDWSDDLRISVLVGGVRTDVTAQLLAKCPHLNGKLGTGQPGPFTTTGTGMIDATSIIIGNGPPHETRHIEFTLKSTGGRVNYDFICD
jgi:hypothetical protein